MTKDTSHFREYSAFLLLVPQNSPQTLISAALPCHSLKFWAWSGLNHTDQTAKVWVSPLKISVRNDPWWGCDIYTAATVNLSMSNSSPQGTRWNKLQQGGSILHLEVDSLVWKGLQMGSCSQIHSHQWIHKTFSGEWWMLGYTSNLKNRKKDRHSPVKSQLNPSSLRKKGDWEGK